jgi:glucosyl-dolichyl phosphate glucuronosyltransferase
MRRNFGSISRAFAHVNATIIICTFNRSCLLDHTLGQLRCLDVPACAEWEILVVNNNSTDDTDAVIQCHSEQLPIRRLWEPRTGKSHAANLAVREAHGDLLLWTDDDVLVDRNWLSSFIQAARANPDASFFGGPIAPWFEIEPPAWITAQLSSIGSCFAIREGFKEPFTPVGPRYLPYGANMATRPHCFDGRPFDVRLGPQGDTEIRGEEEALLHQCLKDGLNGLWVRDAMVQHFIPKERLTERFVWNFYFGYGRTEVRAGLVPQTKEIFGLPRWAVRRYLESAVVSKILSPMKNERWLRAFKDAATCRGVFREYREQRASAKTHAVGATLRKAQLADHKTPS